MHKNIYSNGKTQRIEVMGGCSSYITENYLKHASLKIFYNIKITKSIITYCIITLKQINFQSSIIKQCWFEYFHSLVPAANEMCLVITQSWEMSWYFKLSLWWESKI